MPPADELAMLADLDAGLIRRVAAGRRIVIGAELIAAVDASCAAARRVLSEGSAGRPVYGVNTGMGALSGVRLTEAEQAGHQRNLLLGRAAGGPPWLPALAVRALFAVRLRTFLSGDAGVSARLCQRLAEFLAADIVPAVPAQAAGTAGEILALAHAFGPLAGIGRVLTPGAAAAGADETEPAGPVLARHGLTEFALGPKEGIALLAGVPGATALSLLAAAEATPVLATMAATAALGIAVIGAPADPYQAACARGDEVLARELARLRAGVGSPADPPRMLQAPVSFRVAGPTLAQVTRAAAALDGAVERALAGVTDSPAFLDGKFLGTAGFDGIDLAAHCDQLTAALAHAAEVSAARTHRLLDPRVTGLAAQLAARPGPDAGLVTVHKRAAGEVHALRRLAVPSAATGTIETSGGQEDVQSFAWAAAMTLRSALRHARLVTACELLTAWQAAALAAAAGQPRVAPGGAADLIAAVSGQVDPITADRPLGPDIERLAGGALFS